MSHNEGDERIRVAFGSCYGIFSHKSDIFETVVKDDPDLFVWLGDVAYVDSQTLDFGAMPPEYIKERFQMTKNATGYSTMLQNTAIVGVWDDHDFGTNDGGKHFKFKE